MLPNERTAQAHEIGFVQTVRRGTTPGNYSTLATDPDMGAERAARTMPERSQAWRIDRRNARTRRTPFYGQQATAPGTRTDLSNTQRGRFRGPNPWMEDTPEFGAPQSTLEFVACAVCETAVPSAPNEMGRSYGCINWGFVFDVNRNPPFVPETPTFSIQNTWSDYDDRSRATNRAVDRWNQMTTAYNPVAASGAQIESAPRVQGLPSARVRSSGYVELRREERGRLELTGQRLHGTPGMVSILSVLRRSVERVDHDGERKLMTEVRWGNTVGWVPESDLDFPGEFTPR